MKSFDLLLSFAYRLLIVALFLYMTYLALIPAPTNEQIMDAVFIGVCVLLARTNDMVDQIKKDLE
jgi:hypothetical protein